MIFNYIRVSSVGQNTDRQLIDVPCDRVFEEKVSAKDVNRPELQSLLSVIRRGDVVNVHSLDRLCRNAKDLLTITEEMTAKGASVVFHKENLTLSDDTSNPMNKLILTMFGALAEWERNIILERQREGIALAKSKNKYKGGKQKLTDLQVSELRGMIGKLSRGKIAKHFNITTRSTYKYAPAVK